MESAAFEWGECPCGGQHELRFVEVRMTVEGRVLTLSDVPQGACPRCGSRVYKAETLARIEGLMMNEPFDHRLDLPRP